MDTPTPDRSALRPLPYHSALVDYLRTFEADVWRWAQSRLTHAGHLESLRASLLRDTYRLEPEAHPQVYATLQQAMNRLGISAPATLYQSAGPEMNAALLFVPGEIHVLLQGPVLERMAEDELLALFGHELAHYLLWSDAGGDLLVADRILHDAAAEGGSASVRETCRRYALHTELFADRGGAIAAGSFEPAVTTLVKVQTGIGTVNAAAYLRQAEELEKSLDDAVSQGSSHPETYIRARALALWWQGAPGLDAWIEQRLHGKLALEALDLPGQHRLQGLVRGFVAHFLGSGNLASDAVMAQVRLLFPDWQAQEPAIAPAALGLEQMDDSVRGLLNALMLDLALADPDQKDEALLRAGRVAQELGSFDALQVNLRRDAGFGKQEMNRFKRQLARETE